eukprot:gene1327-32684_t
MMNTRPNSEKSCVELGPEGSCFVPCPSPGKVEAARAQLFAVQHIEGGRVHIIGQAAGQASSRFNSEWVKSAQSVSQTSSHRGNSRHQVKLYATSALVGQVDSNPTCIPRQAKPNFKPQGQQVKVHATSAHVDQGKAYFKPSNSQAKPKFNPMRLPVKAHATSAHVNQGKVTSSAMRSRVTGVCISSSSARIQAGVQASSAPLGQVNPAFKPSQTSPTCKPQRLVKVHATSANGDQGKRRTYTKAAPILQEERAAEIKAIHEELVTALGMAPKAASMVIKAASKSTSVLSLENCRGWITTLRQLGQDRKGLIQGLKQCPSILFCSAAGREEGIAEVLRVLGQAGLRSEQVMHVLQKFPAVLLSHHARLSEKLARLEDMGFPPASERGPLMRDPALLSSSLKYNSVEWLTAKGFHEPLIRKMILNRPALLKYSPEKCLGPMLDYVAWVLGSKEMAVALLTKQPSMFGKRPSSIHAKLLTLTELVGCSPSLMLARNYSITTYSMHTRIGPRCLLLKELGLAEDAELMLSSMWVIKSSSIIKKEKSNALDAWPTLVQAYQDKGSERFPTAKCLEDAIEVCQVKWQLEWKEKFDGRSLMLQEVWAESGIAGLPAIEDHEHKEEE